LSGYGSGFYRDNLRAMDIVTFSPKYLDRVGALIVPIQREEFGVDITYEEQPDLMDIPDFYQRRAGQFWVALDRDQVVGSIGLLDIGAGEAALRKMFVAATHRGGAHGVAAQLLRTLLDHARKNGLKTIYLGTTEKFHAAHRFYEKSGFELIEPESLPATFPRMAVDKRFYRLKIDVAA
jgi:N-acetylglutamate synthase-like GNAT family acetyltransferase